MYSMYSIQRFYFILFKDVFYANQGCIYLIKKTVKR